MKVGLREAVRLKVQLPAANTWGGQVLCGTFEMICNGREEPGKTKIYTATITNVPDVVLQTNHIR